MIINGANSSGRQTGTTTLVPGSSAAQKSGLSDTLKQISTAYTDVLTLSDSIRSRVAAMSLSDKLDLNSVSYVQTARCALADIKSELERGKELAQKAADGEMGAESVQEELDRISANIDDIANNAKWNGENIFNIGGGGASGGTEDILPYEGSCTVVEDGDLDPTNTTHTALYEGVLDNGETAGFSVTYDESDYYAVRNALAMNPSLNEAKLEALVEDLKNKVPDVVGNILQKLPQTAEILNDNLNISLSFTYEPSSTAVASVTGSYSYSDNSGVLGLKLNINLGATTFQPNASGDYELSSYNYGTIAHEMTHAIMDDIATRGMINRTSEKFPLWFSEGMANAVGGGMGHANKILQMSSDSQIKSWLNELKDGSSLSNYAQGYVAVMYLAWKASGEGEVTGDKLAHGIDNILADIANGNSLDSVINYYTSGKFKTAAALQKSFGNAETVAFTKNLKNAIGLSAYEAYTIRAGSVLTGLSGGGSDLIGDGITDTTKFKLVTEFDSVYSNGMAHTAQKTKNLLNGGTTGTNGKPPDGSEKKKFKGTPVKPATPTKPTKPTGGGNGGGGNGGAEGDGDGGTGATVRSNGIRLQVGARTKDAVAFFIGSVSTGGGDDEGNVTSDALKINKLTLADRESALNAVSAFDSAIDKINSIDSAFGALEARLGGESSNIVTFYEGSMDSSAAKELLAYTTSQILNDSQQAITAQIEYLNSEDSSYNELIND